MSLRLFSKDDPSERETEALLPWYVNGTLDDAERARVERHLAQCPRCRREADWLRELRTAVARDAPVPAPELALARAHAQLDELEARWQPAALARRLSAGWRVASWRAVPPVARGALAVQLALIIALAVVLAARREEAAPYRTLSSPQLVRANGDTLSVIFDGATTEAELRSLLASAGARIASGPSAAGVYTLEVASASSDDSIAALRASQLVRFVERPTASTR